MQLIENVTNVNLTLASPLATIDTAGVIGWRLDEAQGRVLILTSSIKLVMFLFYSIVMGPGGQYKGLLSFDFTFKIMKEQLNTATLSTVDNAQHGKLLAFGPSSHEDTEAVCDATYIFTEFLYSLVMGIRARQLPEQWSIALKESVYREYGALVDAHPLAIPAVRTGDIALGQPRVKVHRGLSDLAPAIAAGLHKVLNTDVHSDCWAHTWRAIMPYVKSKMTEAQFNDLYTQLAFFNVVPPHFKDLLFVMNAHEEDAGDEVMVNLSARKQVASWGALYRMFDEEWRKRIDPALVDYLFQHHMLNLWSNAWNEPGEPTTTNAHERMHEFLKAAEHYDTVEGIGTVIHQSLTVGTRLSQWADPFQVVPAVTAHYWKEAQKLVGKGYFNLGFKVTLDGVQCFVFPSTELLKPVASGGLLPDNAKTTAQVTAFLSTWAKEYVVLECPMSALDSHDVIPTHLQLSSSIIRSHRYIQLVKKGNKYEKVTDEKVPKDVQQWDLSTLLDMMFSFWLLKPMPETDPGTNLRADRLREAGIL